MFLHSLRSRACSPVKRVIGKMSVTTLPLRSREARFVMDVSGDKSANFLQQLRRSDRRLGICASGARFVILLQ